MNIEITLKSYKHMWICSFFIANLTILLAILVVLNAQFLWKKNVNLKLEWVKNYNTKPKK